ncbi:MAG: RluA family pseudouridine synthase [Granulosicoccus sp.]|nr:RluA family pseudouridine synthase [Granulosicoccus sp.]
MSKCDDSRMDRPVEASKSRHVRIESESEGQRIDNFLIRHCRGVPRSHLYRQIRTGQVRVDGRRIKQTRKLRAGEIVRIPAMKMRQVGEVTVPGNLLDLISRSIIFEHEDFLILNKPPGLAVHGGTDLAFGLIDVLRQQQDNSQFELSHRLDRATSGCLIVARDRRRNAELQNLFRHRQIEKQYVALVDGHWPSTQRTIDAPIAKNIETAGQRRMEVDQSGLSATSHFSVVGRAEEATLVEVSLETGRTHQIRVHARHVGHPIVGDNRYGDNRRNAMFRQLGLLRLFLHARSLAFQWKDQPIQVCAPTDKPWQAAIDGLGMSYQSAIS